LTAPPATGADLTSWRVDISDPELDPRWAANYDQENRWDQDDEFYLALAAERPGCRVVDLGCGTGRLTIALATAGHPVVGVDPNPAFLAIAAGKGGSERVAWVRGTSRDLPSGAFDLALMTSHVAQVFITDWEWVEVLGDMRRALAPGGVLAFESRHPAYRAWERWADAWDGVRREVLADGTVVDMYTTTTFVDDVFTADSASVLSDGTEDHRPVEQALAPGTTWSRARWSYRFRSPELIRRSLEEAGFRVERMLGGWQGEPLGQGDEIVVVASR